MDNEKPFRNFSELQNSVDGRQFTTAQGTTSETAPVTGINPATPPIAIQNADVAKNFSELARISGADNAPLRSSTIEEKKDAFTKSFRYGLGKGAVSSAGMVGATTLTGSPVLGFVGGMITNALIGDKAGEMLGGVPPDKIIEPARSWAHAGEILGEGLAFAPAPSMMGRLGGTLTQAQRTAMLAMKEGAPGSFQRTATSLLPGATPLASMINRNLGRAGVALDNILTQAAKSPIESTVLNAGASVGAAYGGFIADTQFQDNKAASFAGQIIGQLPANYVFSPVYQGAVLGLRKVADVFTGEGPMRIIGTKIQNAVIASGDDPVRLAALLREASLVPGLDPAAKTGNVVLSSAKDWVAKNVPEALMTQNAQANKQMEAVWTIVQTLKGTGDPRAVREAAIIASRAYDDAMLRQFDELEKYAIAAARATADRNPMAMQDLGNKLAEAFHKIEKIYSGHNTELWKIASAEANGIFSPAKNSKDAWANVKKAVKLPSERLDSSIEAEMARIISPPRPKGVPGSPEEAFAQSAADFDTLIGNLSKRVPIKDGVYEVKINDVTFKYKVVNGQPEMDVMYLQSVRSKALDIARMEATPTEAKMYYNKIAEGIQKDLEIVDNGTSSLREAKDFTKLMHDRIGRSWVGTALAKNNLGAYKISPELLGEAALAGTDNKTAKILSEMREAAQTLEARKLVGDPEASTQAMESMQVQLMRILTAKAIDPQTQRLDPNRLGKILNENQATLQHFQGVKTSLENALKKGNELGQLEQMMTGVSEGDAARLSFERLLKAQDQSPQAYVKQILTPSSGNLSPMRDLKSLVDFAKSSREAVSAVPGLRKSIWDWAIMQSSKQNVATGKIEIDYRELQSLMFQRIGGIAENPRLIDFMKKEGLLSADDVKRTVKLFTEFNRMMKSAEIGNSALAGSMLETTAGLEKFLARAIGAVAATQGTKPFRDALAPGSQGAQLAIAGGGATAVENAVGKRGLRRFSDIVDKMVTSNEFAAQIMEIEKLPKLLKAERLNTLFLQMARLGMIDTSKQDPEGELMRPNTGLDAPTPQRRAERRAVPERRVTTTGGAGPRAMLQTEILQ